jgi:hypothetical protein
VEAAISFPLVVVVFLLTVQGAMYVHARNVVVGAAREGAHAAALEHDTLNEALEDGRQRAASILAAGLGGYAHDIDAIAVDDEGGNIVVEIRGTFSLLAARPGRADRLALPLQARARASYETFRPQGQGGY